MYLKFKKLFTSQNFSDSKLFPADGREFVFRKCEDYRYLCSSLETSMQVVGVVYSALYCMSADIMIELWSKYAIYSLVHIDT